MFEGIVSDDEDEPSSLQVEWRSSVDEIVSSSPSDVNGRTLERLYCQRNPSTGTLC